MYKEMTSTEDKNLTRNFKNLRINVDNEAPDDMVCHCPTYFNTENQGEVSPSEENSPTTVKSVGADSSCTYGTHYPNRIFVGHLPGKANANDLADFFGTFGTVLEGKVVLDSYGRSRRFGFVTFTSHEDVQNVLSQGTIFFKGKKINVGPAVKKMFGVEMSPPASPDNVTNGIASPVSSSPESGDETSETIITVPPVNEVKDCPDSPVAKHGNVWLKVNTKAKTPVKKTFPDVKSPTTPTYVAPQATLPYQQYVYPTLYTVPYNAMYNYQGVYMPYQQPNMYPNTPCAQPMIPYQWSQGTNYVRGPVTVS